jgi:hypothetical protein
MTQLSDEQLATVEKAIRLHFGFAWKGWRAEAHVIWNALSSQLVEEVERLRATFNTQGQTVLRQCDEIEALRAENERLTARAEKAEAYMDKFAAESNRLREALEGE